MFIALALPVTRTSQGKTWQKAFMVALLFCILTASNLLIPTTLMPEAVRLTQFYEIAIPGFIFGALVVWFMNRSHSSVRDMFRRETKEGPEAVKAMQAQAVLVH